MELDLKAIRQIGRSKTNSAYLNLLLRLLASENTTDLSHRCDLTELYHYSNEGREIFIFKPKELNTICIDELKPTMKMLLESPDYEYVRKTMKARGFDTFGADDLLLAFEHRELFNTIVLDFNDVVTDDNYEYSTNPNDYHRHFKDAKDAEPQEIYALHLNEDCNTHLFDVVEEDFIKMADLGLVNTECNYYLLEEYTHDEIKAIRKQFGSCFDDILQRLKC